ncbi:hypothetical protein SBDP1_70022 [Syntrophobacter sp. SbD1]|nr:hypothetical protein SBDP1_70022 [Syntrophobacter sp. SbD1]
MSEHFLNYDTVSFAGVTVLRVFYCEVGISILFQHPTSTAFAPRFP